MGIDWTLYGSSFLCGNQKGCFTIEAYLVSRLFYFFLFYIAWAFCLLGVATGRPWIGPLLVFILAIGHFVRVRGDRQELLLSIVMIVGGTAIDTLLLNSGLVDYYGGYREFPWLAPLWVSSIWLLFSLTVTTSFDWLRRSLWLSIPFGAVGGALSYLAAVRAGAAYFPDPALAIGSLALLWGLLMPLILWFSQDESKKQGKL